MNKDIKFKKTFKGILKDWIIPILISVIIAFLINRFVIFKIEIPSESMAPTINIGDKLFAHRIYSNKNLNRGDLIIFKFDPEDKLYIKRLIGLPNDEIIINDGSISINGELLVESYINNNLEFNGEFKVPEGKYFFLGDNRANSTDSRFWVEPYIEFNDIRGKAFIKVYPFNEIKFME